MTDGALLGRWGGRRRGACFGKLRKATPQGGRIGLGWSVWIRWVVLWGRLIGFVVVVVWVEEGVWEGMLGDAESVVRVTDEFDAGWDRVYEDRREWCQQTWDGRYVGQVSCRRSVLVELCGWAFGQWVRWSRSFCRKSNIAHLSQNCMHPPLNAAIVHVNDR